MNISLHTGHVVEPLSKYSATHPSHMQRCKQGKKICEALSVMHMQHKLGFSSVLEEVPGAGVGIAPEVEAPAESEA